MASIYKDISLDARPEDVWAAVRDYGAVHQRVAPGFVTDCKLDGDSRIVTFANGNVAQELLVTMDDARMRLVYAVVSPRVKQHSASIQVLADGEGRSRVCGLPTYCRTRSALTSMARWSWALRRCRRRSGVTRRERCSRHSGARAPLRVRTRNPETGASVWIPGSSLRDAPE
jgi:hypothetical protein